MKYNHNHNAKKIKIRVIWFVKNMCIRRYAMNWVTHKPSFEFENFSLLFGHNLRGVGI